MAHTNHAQLAFCFALLLVLALAFTSSEVDAADSPRLFKKHKLKYYVQLQFGAPNIALTFLPPLNTTFSDRFGAGVLFAFNVTKEISLTSKLLGSVRGFTVETSFLAGAPSLGLEVATIQYDDGRFAGTLQVHGLVQQATPTEVAITGGTGSFRGARGYLLISMEPNSPPGFSTFLHQLHLL